MYMWKRTNKVTTGETIGATIERPETRRRAGVRGRGTNVRLSRKRY